MKSTGRNPFKDPEEHPGTGKRTSAAHHSPTSRPSAVAGDPNRAVAPGAEGTDQYIERCTVFPATTTTTSLTLWPIILDQNAQTELKEAFQSCKKPERIILSPAQVAADAA